MRFQPGASTFNMRAYIDYSLLCGRYLCVDPGSLLAMLTSAVGDLASITIPITYMEPTSFLQRLTEAFQNSELLDKVNTGATFRAQQTSICSLNLLRRLTRKNPVRLLTKKTNSNGSLTLQHFSSVVTQRTSEYVRRLLFLFVLKRCRNSLARCSETFQSVAGRDV